VAKSGLFFKLSENDERRHGEYKNIIKKQYIIEKYPGYSKTKRTRSSRFPSAN